MPTREQWNGIRYAADDRGHYESYFQRANHPREPRAFWIRYTLFSPKGKAGEAIGELWAIYFDRSAGRIVAVRETRPLADCQFSKEGLQARIGEATLDGARLAGSASHNGHRLAWDLSYTSPQDPLLLLDEPLYGKGFPKAKALVGSPFAAYAGTLEVDGERMAIDGWVGSQNHNWGVKHTDAYAWGQVAGFDDAPDVFLECSTARIKLGPVWTPRFTVVALRVGERNYALNTLGQALKAKGRYDFFTWELDSRQGNVRVRARIEAPASAFVGLTYLNPPGGAKTCLNSKIASCHLTLEDGGARRELRTDSRAAFEILTQRTDHGVPVAV